MTFIKGLRLYNQNRFDPGRDALHRSSQRRLSAIAPLALLITLMIALAGCSSTGKPAAASFASVVIENHDVSRIRGVTEQVFREHGYTSLGGSGRTMVFEAAGSKMNNLAYEGVVGSHYGAQTLVRVKAEVVPLGEGSHRLQCQTYMVRSAGDSFFEEEVKLSNLRAGPYRKILREVDKRLE